MANPNICVTRDHLAYQKRTFLIRQMIPHCTNVGIGSQTRANSLTVFYVPLFPKGPKPNSRVTSRHLDLKAERDGRPAVAARPVCRSLSGSPAPPRLPERAAPGLRQVRCRILAPAYIALRAT